MRLNRKCKQKLREISIGFLKICKLSKLEQENQQRKEILRRQRDKKDFWNK